MQGFPAQVVSESMSVAGHAAINNLHMALGIRVPPGLSLPLEKGRERSPSVCSTVAASESDTASYLSEPVREKSMRECRTTLYVRNLPYYITRQSFMQIMDSHGLAGQYDLVYLPLDFNTWKSMGYGFVNFRNSTAALVFWAAMDGFHWPCTQGRCSKVCSVQWSQTQGLEKNIKVVRRSDVLRSNCMVPEEFKPAIFNENGKLVPFLQPPGRAEKAKRQPQN